MPAKYFSGLYSSRNLRISRPRFWAYVLGPFVVGAVAAMSGGGSRPDVWLILLGLYFTYPANFIIYGANDVYDYDTDKHNPKKQGYEELVTPEQGWRIMRQVLAWIVIGYLLLEFVPGEHDAAHWGLLAFFFFGLGYSVPPIRAKARPLLDSIFNVLYVCPAIVSYGVVAGRFPDWRLLAAAGVWCMAMHAYSAVPDIKADTKAGVRTIATWLGARGCLVFCLACYVAAAALSWPELAWFSLAGGTLYAMIMLVSLVNPERERIFRLYKYFPYLNMAVGAGLFFFVLLK